MRMHILGVPHTVTSKDFNHCAFTQKVLKFIKMMTPYNCEMIHYGHEDSEVDCEHVTVVNRQLYNQVYGNHDHHKHFFTFDINDSVYKTFYGNTIKEIQLRKQPNDFVLAFWGEGVRPVCDAHSDLIIVEPGIGYPTGHFAPYKVYESYAIYHAYYGMNGVKSCCQNWYDVVIPNYFDLTEFEYKKEKSDYFLYLGRVYEGKGVHIACQVAERLGLKLKVAGQKEDGYILPDSVEYIGYADVNKRKELMSNARASFIPSCYIEPFGGVMIENFLSGTPVISTDWGSFSENNIHGLTGYRCRTFNDFIQAVNNIHKINQEDCRKWGERFSLENIGRMYWKYFNDILRVHTGNKLGWYSQYNEDDLDILSTGLSIK